VINVLQDLDDPFPLAEAEHEQRQAIFARGERLRRRRHVTLLGVPVVIAAAVVTTAVALTGSPGAAGRHVVTPVTQAPPVLELPENGKTATAAYYDCDDADDDNPGGLEVDFFSLDTPSEPLFHFGLVAGNMPTTGLIELRMEATSADGERARELVQQSRDGRVIEQYVRDPNTGARIDVPHEQPAFETDAGTPARGGAHFPSGSLSGLGDGWTWTASMSVNDVVVDSCDRAHGLS
jgi:hypothetical protein